jgi:hypothetical protein
MTKKAKPRIHDRRSFLKNGMALAGGAALAVAAGPGRAQIGAARKSSGVPKASASGYHETPHILEYYKLAKL